MTQGLPQKTSCVKVFLTLIFLATLSLSTYAQDPSPGACLTLGPNLVENPEFDDGNTGFLSSYIFNPDYTCNFGQYTVANTIKNDPIGGAACYSGTGFDLTTIWAASDRNDPGNGNFLILDPTDTAGGAFILWQQTIDVCPGSEYVFSSFAKNLFFLEASWPYSDIDPIFELTINGAPPSQSYFVDGVLTPSGTFDPLARQSIADSTVWTQISGRWNSGTATSATITIKNTVPGNEGNDIAVDGIFFGLCNRSVDIAPSNDIGQCAQLNTVQAVTLTVPASTIAAGWQYYEWSKDGAVVLADPNPVSFLTPADINGEYFGTYQLRVYDDPAGPANGACGSLSEALTIFEDCPTSFPVELTSFDGVFVGNQAQLSWNTASESQNKGFEVWMAPRGESFNQIGFVPGNGTTQSPSSYQLLTNGLLPGVYAFQLRQIDFDGKVNTSNVVELTLESQPALYVQLYPNPANNSATVDVQLPLEAPVVIELIGVDGKSILTKSFEAVPGQKSVSWNMPLENVAAGYYLVKVRGISQKVVPLTILR